MSDPDALHRRNEMILAAMPVSRTCAGCDLCCTAVGVEEIAKPPAVRCQHLLGIPGASCSIYKTRPGTCREFLCLWRGSDKVLAPELFPARCGFVVVMTVGPPVRPMVFTVHPDPARPDTWRDHKPVFLRLADKFNAIVVVGQAHLACAAFAPSGREFTEEEHPQFFADEDVIGIPAEEFHDRWPTMQMILNELW